jgi:hypothetical protein
MGKIQVHYFPIRGASSYQEDQDQDASVHGRGVGMWAMRLSTGQPPLHRRRRSCAGRGEPIKLALAAKGVEFEPCDVDYAAMKSDLTK